jgi:hypothetical protein
VSPDKIPEYTLKIVNRPAYGSAIVLKTIAEKGCKSVHDLRRQWLEEMYELGCLTHENYHLIVSWIEGMEAVEMLDCQILDYYETIGSE